SCTIWLDGWQSGKTGRRRPRTPAPCKGDLSVVAIPQAPNQPSHFGETADSGSLASGAVTAFVQRLVREMNAAWRQGGGCSAERILDCYPELAEHKDAAVRIIYEEICLRQEMGQEVTTAEIIRRFPQWQA